MSKVLYLTIDDFPTKTSEDMLLFLKEKNISCILFCIGKDLEKQADLAVKALQMGFILGNHSYSHPAFSKLSLKSAYKEIEETHLLLEEIHKMAGIAWRAKYFRFPYGDKGDGKMGRIFTKGYNPWKRLKKSRIQKRLSELGYTNLQTAGITYGYYQNFLAQDCDAHWTLDVMEWCLKRPDGMFNLKQEEEVLTRLFSDNPFDCRGTVPEAAYGIRYNASSEVVLLHDCEQTFPVFKNVINEMLSRGHRFAAF